jgi:hypothetical protein
MSFGIERREVWKRSLEGAEESIRSWVIGVSLWSLKGANFLARLFLCEEAAKDLQDKEGRGGNSRHQRLNFKRQDCLPFISFRIEI